MKWGETDFANLVLELALGESGKYENGPYKLEEVRG